MGLNIVQGRGGIWRVFCNFFLVDFREQRRDLGCYRVAASLDCLLVLFQLLL